MTQPRASLRRFAGCQAGLALAGVLCAPWSAFGQSPQTRPTASCPPADQQASLVGSSAATEPVIQKLRGASFPELASVDLRVRTFQSQSDYLRTRFSMFRFLFVMRMRYFVDINPALFQQQAPPDGVCAILAHELVHVVSLNRGNRIRRFGLVRLLSKSSTVKFERAADLDAIHRGYGDGLKSYRNWVYAHIPADKLQEKRRNYFSPEEIAAIQEKTQKQPDPFVYWSKHVPLNLQEIQGGPKCDER